MYALKKRLLETEEQMTRILHAMESMQQGEQGELSVFAKIIIFVYFRRLEKYICFVKNNGVVFLRLDVDSEYN